MATDEPSQGVSNCYVFKSRLQEYAQKVGLSTPVYETVKEGPSHQPTFRSTVIVNDVRYDSLPDFFNRKAAEQSAAEVALVKMAQSGEMEESVSQPLHETGLCKNLLQEYAQKMNYPMPVYEFRKDETQGRGVMFSCTAEIGGIKYIGGFARTKKEAEIKAARTALFAIQSSPSELAKKLPVNTEYTVLPFKKSSGVSTTEPTKAALKPKKRRCKKKKLWNKKKRVVNGENPSSEARNNVQNENGNGNTEISVVLSGNGDSKDGNLISADMQVSDSGFPLPEPSNTIQYGYSKEESVVVSDDIGSKDGNGNGNRNGNVTSADMQVSDSGFPLTEPSNTIQYGYSNKEDPVVVSDCWKF